MASINRNVAIEVILASFTAAATAAAFVLLVKSGLKSEDVFAFTGALVGAAATVAGAAWIADRTQAKDRYKEQCLISEDLTALFDVSRAALVLYPVDTPWTDNWRSALSALGDIASGSARFLDEVIEFAKTLDFSQRELIKAARADIVRFNDFYQDVQDPDYQDSPMDERDWPSMIGAMAGSTKAALATLTFR